MPLTDVACRNAKPAEGGKPRKLFDGGGLYLLVKPVGKYWRFDYRFAGKYRTPAPWASILMCRWRPSATRRGKWSSKGRGTS